jgi:hypothetical protein
MSSLFSLIVGEGLIKQKWLELQGERAKLTREYCDVTVREALKAKRPNDHWDKPDALQEQKIAIWAAELYGYYRGRMDAKEEFLRDL